MTNIKIMTESEKAKAYDEALERARKLATDLPNGRNDRLYHVWDLEKIFPELKESEDEKIRKELIDYHRSMAAGADDYVHETWIDWLEKQGEQKTADKVEPKFHKGEWIVWQDKCYKVNYNGCGYELVDQNGLITSLEYGTVEENAHLWDITKDAKAGDVLAHGNLPFIFKKIDTNKHSYAYCGISVYSGFKIESDWGTGEWTWMQDVIPATKEQRETLFKAMHEAGYEWDDEKKELKKICSEEVNGEEDEKTINKLMAVVELYYGIGDDLDKQRCLSWLKSLKERLEQK